MLSLQRLHRPRQHKAPGGQTQSRSREESLREVDHGPLETMKDTRFL